MIRSAANLPERVQVFFEGEGRARQSMRDECDINIIMARYLKTGAINHFAKHGGDYGFASSVGFHEAMNVVVKAEQMFADLPSAVRRRVGSPDGFLSFVQDASNEAELVELGLSNARPAAPEAPTGGERTPEVIVPGVPESPVTPPEGG